MNEIITINTTALQAQPTFTNLADEYIDYLQVKEVTAKSYVVCIRCFLEWLQANNVMRPQYEDIRNYAVWLSTPHASRKGDGETITFAAGTQARYLRAVKSMFRWLSVKNRYPNVADGVKGAKVRADNTKRDPLQREDAVNLLDSIDRSTEIGKRDYAMILLSITAGLRIIEMQRAEIGGLETIAGEKVLFIQGKGHDEADAYKKLTPEVAEAINDYLQTRQHKDAHAPLFAGVGNRSRERRLTEPSISRIIKNRMKAAGYDTHRLSAHSLRHTSVTFLLEAGATIQEAQHHARHASPETTGIYAHNLDQRKDHSEQRIYDYLFGIETNASQKAVDFLARMDATKQAQALQILQAMAG